MSPSSKITHAALLLSSPALAGCYGSHRIADDAGPRPDGSMLRPDAPGIHPDASAEMFCSGDSLVLTVADGECARLGLEPGGRVSPPVGSLSTAPGRGVRIESSGRGVVRVSASVPACAGVTCVTVDELLRDGSCGLETTTTAGTRIRWTERERPHAEVIVYFVGAGATIEACAE